MRLVYKFNYKGKHIDKLFNFCEINKKLYNQALYAIKQELKNNNRFLFYNDLDKLMKITPTLEGEINYKLIKAQVSQQCLKNLDKNIKSYIRAIKDWSKNKSKYNGIPKFPKYKKKYNLLIYTNQCSSIKNGYIFLAKDLIIKIPQYSKFENKLSNFQQIRILPKANHTLDIEIVYECNNVFNIKLDKTKYTSIDLGVDNVATVIFDENETILYNGKQLKSKNQFVNKVIARHKSELEKKNKSKTSKRIKNVYNKRNDYMNDYFHKLSRNIINKVIKYNIGTIVVGYNKGWKDSINIGKRNNQAFVQIPFENLINKLQYKCEQCGIKFIINEESYTSKCDALAHESIEKHDIYLGKRIKRGLYQSSMKKLINADVNGALNILRKVIGDSDVTHRIIDSGRLFRPLKCNIL